MVTAIICYWIIQAVIGHQTRTATAPWILPMILMGESVVIYVGGWWWHGRMMRLMAEQVTATHVEQLSVEGRLRLQTRLQASVIICLVLFESPAVFGLVNSFMTSPLPQLFEWLASISLASLIVFRLRGYPTIFQALEHLEHRTVVSG